MRIAAVVHNSVKHDARVLKGAGSLKAQGHDVRIFGLTSEASEEFVLPNGVPVHLQYRDLSGVKNRAIAEGLKAGRESSIWTSFRTQGDQLFERVKKTFEPDTVHIHDHVALTAASRYHQELGSPIVWDAHEIYEDLASIEDVRAHVNARIIDQNSQFVSGFITLNKSIAQFYREKYPRLPEAVLIPNAASRVKQPEYDGRLHHAARLRPEQKILLFQGGYSLHRGIHALLESSSHLNDDWSLVFMGWGKLEQDIRSYADLESDRPPGRARVAMVKGAPHDELLAWTAGASLGTIPYENTGLNHLYCSPNKLWEYPAAGVPILASDMPEMKSKIDDCGIGLTVNRALNAKEIADSVNSLKAQELQDMRANCANFANKENWTTYAARLTELHMHIAGEHEIAGRSQIQRFTRWARRVVKGD